MRRLTPTILERDGAAAFVVVPIEQWQGLIEDLEAIEDIRAFDEAQAVGGVAIPKEVFERVLAGANPIQVYREWRELTQRALAESVGVTTKYISHLERGRRSGSVKILGRIADCLDVDLEDLVAGATAT